MPSKTYENERGFQQELQEFIDTELNRQKFFGESSEFIVDTEHGRGYADIVVNNRIDIKLRRELTNSHTKKLRGQIEKHSKVYDHVIVCACGVADMNGWRRVKDVKSTREIADGYAEKTPETFIHKGRSKFGKLQEHSSSGEPAPNSSISTGGSSQDPYDGVDEVDLE